MTADITVILIMCSVWYVSRGLVMLYLIVNVGGVCELGFGDTVPDSIIGGVCELGLGDTVLS